MILVTKTTVVTVPLARNLKKSEQQQQLFQTYFTVGEFIYYYQVLHSLVLHISEDSHGYHVLSLFVQKFSDSCFPHIFFSLENCTMQSLQELHLFLYFCKKLIGTRLKGFFFLRFSSELLNLDLMTNYKEVSHCTLHGISKVSLCIYEIINTLLVGEYSA